MSGRLAIQLLASSSASLAASSDRNCDFCEIKNFKMVYKARIQYLNTLAKGVPDGDINSEGLEDMVYLYYHKFINRFDSPAKYDISCVDKELLDLACFSATEQLILDYLSQRENRPSHVFPHSKKTLRWRDEAGEGPLVSVKEIPSRVSQLPPVLGSGQQQRGDLLYLNISAPETRDLEQLHRPASEAAHSDSVASRHSANTALVVLSPIRVSELRLTILINISKIPLRRILLGRGFHIPLLS